MKEPLGLVNQLTSDADESKPDESRFPSRAGRQLVGLRLDRQLLKKARVLVALSGVSLQTLVEQGLQIVLAEAGSDWLTKQPHDELMIDDGDLHSRETPSSESSIPRGTGQLVNQSERESGLLAFYSEHTGNRVRERDRAALRGMLHLSDSAIKAGIGRSIVLCRTRVNSLSYCLGAIEDEAESGPERVAYVLSKIKRPKPGAQPNLPTIGADVLELGGKR